MIDWNEIYSGLYKGTAGEPSRFFVQSKDDHGNDRTDDQARDRFLVVPNIPTVDYDIFERTAPGMLNQQQQQQEDLPGDDPFAAIMVGAAVSSSAYAAGDYVGGGQYEFSFVPILSGQYTIAVMTQLTAEVQVVTTRFPGPAPNKREGYFQLAIDQIGGDGTITDLDGQGTPTAVSPPRLSRRSRSGSGDLDEGIAMTNLRQSGAAAGATTALGDA